MVSLLIVDDELFSLRVYTQGVDWRRAGVDEVQTASSAKAAYALMRERPVDVLILDVEMPRDTGFDLLAWLAKDGLAPKVIILSSYDQFEYCRQALAYHCVDYLVKPVPLEKLLACVLSTVRLLEREREELNARDRLMNDRANRFFYSLLTGASGLTAEEILAAAADKGLALRNGASYLLVLLRCRGGFAQGQQSDEWRLRGLLQQRLAERLGMRCLSVVNCDEERNLYVLEAEGAGSGSLWQQLNELLRVVRQEEGLDIEGYLGRLDCVERLAAQYRFVTDYEKNLVVRDRSTVSVYAQSVGGKAYQAAEWKRWVALLRQMNGAGAAEEIERYLRQRAAQKQWDARLLEQFQYDFVHALLVLLDENGIPSTALYARQDFAALRAHATDSVLGAVRFTRYLIDSIIELECEQSNSRDVVDRVCQYIDSHLFSELSRDELAAYAHVSPEYLSRLFRRERGERMFSYVRRRKMEEAQKLLAQTELSVSEVAQRLGYQNFAYFSRVFHEDTRLSPSEYRRRERGE